MKDRTSHLNKELIVWYGVFSLVFSIGIIFLGFMFFGIDVRAVNSGLMALLYIVIFGGIWGFLLCRNC